MPTKLVTIDLSQPLPPRIDGAEAYDAVWVFVMRYGIPLGQVEIDNLCQPVTAVQLRSEIVRQMADQLLQGYDYQDAKAFDWAVGQKEQVPEQFASEPELAGLLPALEPELGHTYYLSIVVCTRDRPDDLQLCLESLTALDPGRHRLELIVVDNNPDSGQSEPVVHQFPMVRYEVERRAGVAYARNKGLLTARGDVVAYIDDDVVVPPTWPSRILAPFSDTRVMCVSGLVMPLELENHSQEMFEKYGALGRGYQSRIFDEHFFWRSKKHVVHTWELGGTANVAIRKSVLPESGMFDETLGPGLPTGVGEDIYMFYRILKAGYICYYEPAAYVWHKHRQTMRALRKQLFNYNKGQTSYQLRTLVTDGDRRAIRQLLWDLPKWHLRRIWEILRGRQDYSLQLVAVEIWGNLIGPLAFWRAVRQHRRLNGPGTNPINAISPLASTPEASAGKAASFTMSDYLPVSIVVPAYNAAATITETIDSVLAQTMPHWELIVVDDGSTDETVKIVQQYCQSDGRIRLLQQARQGACAARNAGLRCAAYDWVLFFDADDLLLPEHLQMLTAVAAADSTLDGVHSAWTRLAPGGIIMDEDRCQATGDLFDLFACRCAFPPFTCIVRRHLATAVGGFDESVQSNQDWDFWQRITRLGARFGAVEQVLGRYRMRPGSVSTNDPVQFFADGLRLINLGHGPDPRIAHLQPLHKNGRDPADISQVRLMWVCWSAGLLLGREEDARPLLDKLAADRWPDFDPYGLARCLFRAVSIGRYETFDKWYDLWPKLQERVRQFLVAFEAQSGAPQLAARAQIDLERLILDHTQRARPLTLGGTHAVYVDVERPLPEFDLPSQCILLRCEVWLEETYLGTVEFDVQESPPTGAQISDALAQKFAWPILGRFFAHTLLPTLHIVWDAAGASVWRGDLHLGDYDALDTAVLWEKLFADVGWTLFLQEVWNRPAWNNANFYDEQFLEKETKQVRQKHFRRIVEVGAIQPDLLCERPELEAVLQVAGEEVCHKRIPVVDGMVSAQRIRAILSLQSGFDLCHVVVRQALLGRPLTDPATLRQRLRTKMTIEDAR